MPSGLSAAAHGFDGSRCCMLCFPCYYLEWILFADYTGPSPVPLSGKQCSISKGHKPALYRCIDKAGGLDRYLLQTREDRVQSDLGMKLKAQIHAARQQHLPLAAPAGGAEGAGAESIA